MTSSTFGIKRNRKRLTVEELKDKLPVKKNAITQEVVDYVNDIMENPDFDAGTFIGTLIDYQSILLDTKASIQEYTNALMFCAYLEVETSLVEAYKKARPRDDFVRARLDCEVDSNEYNSLYAAASRYRKSKLVRKILAQSELPLHIVFQVERMKAVSVLARVMVNAKLDRDKINAAKELLAATKGPDTAVIDLNVGPTEAATNMQTKLFEQLGKMSQIQYDRLQGGANIVDVQRVGLELDTGNTDGEA